MASPARSRPVSAATINSVSTATHGSNGSYFTDRSAILGLGGLPKNNRPLPDLLSLAVDAAHLSHDNRKVLHSPTHAYSVFNWRVSAASQKPNSPTPSTVVTGRQSPTAIYSGPDPVRTRALSAPDVFSSHPVAVTTRPFSACVISQTASRLSAVKPAISRPLLSSNEGDSINSGCFRAARESSGSGCPLMGRSRSSGGDGVGPVTTTAAGVVVSDGVASQTPGGLTRPGTATRPQSPWEGAELEVVCLYDSNFQTANHRGQHGPPLRVPSRTHIGPISYLYRWYCKRSTQFRGDPPAWALESAPALPQTLNVTRGSPRHNTTWTPASGAPYRGSSSSGGSTSSSASGTSGLYTFIDGLGATARGSTASGDGTSGATVWRPPPPSMRPSGGVRSPIGSDNGSSIRSRARALSTTAAAPAGSRSGNKNTSGSRESSGGAGGGGSGTTAGRCLNLDSDPVISLAEVVDMLEDLEVVPHLASRLDIKQLFQAASKAAAATAGTAAAAAATSAVAPTTPPAQPAKQRPDLATSQQNISSPGRPGNGQSTVVSFKLRNPQPPTSPTGPSRGPASGTSTSGEPQPSTTQPAQRSQPQRSDMSRTVSRNAVRSASSASLAFPTGAPGKFATGAASSSNDGTGNGGRGTGAGGDDSGGVIPRAQVHPEEIRFPVFKDMLVRLANAVACNDSPYVNADVAAAAAAGAASRRSSSSSGTCVGGRAASSAAATSAGGATAHRGRTMSYDDAIEAVRRLLEYMGLYRSDLRGLRNRLDELARFAAEHGIKAQANRRQHFAVRSPVAAAQDVAVAATPAAPPPTAMAAAMWIAAASRPTLAWSVLSAAPAPSYLHAVLAEEDVGDEDMYRPAWREFGSRALDLGVLEPGELRQCRLMLHNRGTHLLSARLDASAAPFCHCSHVGLQSVPPGLPLRIDIAVRLRNPGEVVGELRLYYTTTKDRQEREILVPVYGMVRPPSGGAVAVTGRTRPTAASERSVLAVKAVKEVAVATPAVVAAAALAPPLRHVSSRQASMAGASDPGTMAQRQASRAYGSVRRVCWSPGSGVGDDGGGGNVTGDGGGGGCGGGGGTYASQYC